MSRRGGEHGRHRGAARHLAERLTSSARQAAHANARLGHAMAAEREAHKQATAQAASRLSYTSPDVNSRMLFMAIGDQATPLKRTPASTPRLNTPSNTPSPSPPPAFSPKSQTPHCLHLLTPHVPQPQVSDTPLVFFFAFESHAHFCPSIGF